MNNDKFGNVVQVLGPVIDVEFSGDLPPINTALRISNNLIDEKEWNLVVEVAQQIGSKRVRCIAMDTTDGIKRGAKVLDTGNPISVPVGKAALGRMMNVVGEPIDGKGEIASEELYPIHKPAPTSKTRVQKLKSLKLELKSLIF